MDLTSDRQADGRAPAEKDRQVDGRAPAEKDRQADGRAPAEKELKGCKQRKKRQLRKVKTLKTSTKEKYRFRIKEVKISKFSTPGRDGGGGGWMGSPPPLLNLGDYPLTFWRLRLKIVKVIPNIIIVWGKGSILHEKESILIISYKNRI